MGRLATSAIAGVLLAVAACGDDDGGEPPSELEEQVAAAVADGAEDVRVRLETLGVSVEGAELEGVEGGDLLCPRVTDPEPGDRATCELTLEPALVLVDVEFAADGSVSVIGIEVRELAEGDDAVEDAVEAVIAGRLDPDVSSEIVCPGASRPDPGEAVTCRASVDGGASEPFTLTADESGALVFDTAVLDRAAVEAFLVGELEVPAEGPVEVDCGDVAVLAGEVGDVLLCDAVRVADGAAYDVVLQIRSTDGELDYEVRGR